MSNISRTDIMNFYSNDDLYTTSEHCSHAFTDTHNKFHLNFKPFLETFQIVYLPKLPYLNPQFLAYAALT